jgi:hypothetical protein
MKKMLLAAALLCGVATTSQAGNLQGVTLSGAPQITVLGGYAQAAPLQAEVTITNSSGRTLRLGLQRQIQQEVAGTENNFCFGVNCYPPNITTSPSPIVLANAATDNSMILDYTPNNLAGITTIRYAVYEVGTSDSTYVTVRFDASRALLATAASRAPESVLSQPWPNPASGSTQLDFQLPAGKAQGGQLVLVSLADGRRLRNISLTSQPNGSFSGILPGGCYVGTNDLVTPSAKVVGAGAVVLQLQDVAPGFYSCLLLDGRGQLLAARRLLVQ